VEAFEEWTFFFIEDTLIGNSDARVAVLHSYDIQLMLMGG